jgi:hypothetical protein
MMIGASKSWLSVCAATFCLIASGRAVVAAPPAMPYNRPCGAEDLEGLWKIVEWSTFGDKSQLDTYADPHQWFLFGSDGTLRSMSGAETDENAAEVKKSLQKIPAVIYFMCPTPGTLETIRSDHSGQSELWKAFYVTKDTANGKADLRTGDVVMMLIGKDRQPVYVRQLRKLTK